MEKHLEIRKPCSRLEGAPQVCTFSSDSLAALRVALGIPLRAVAAGIGMSKATVTRAVNGHVGGKGRTRQEVRDQVAEFLGAPISEKS